MKTIEYSWTGELAIKKASWPPGPWHQELDKRQWLDPETGYPCLIRRVVHSGVFCGYVGVPRGHPAYGLGWDDDRLRDLDAHGGVNFSNRCDPRADEATGICHVVEPGESDDVYWFGFDCAHAWDAQPGMTAQLRELSITMPAAFRDGVDPFAEDESDPIFGSVSYRTREYVEKECRELARQLKAMEG